MSQLHIFQQIKHKAIKIEILAVIVVFVEKKYIFPENITNAVEDYFFAFLLIVKREKDTTKKIVSFIYKDNMQIKKEGDLSAFHKIDPLLL